MSYKKLVLNTTLLVLLMAGITGCRSPFLGYLDIQNRDGETLKQSGLNIETNFPSNAPPPDYGNGKNNQRLENYTGSIFVENAANQPIEIVASVSPLRFGDASIDPYEIFDLTYAAYTKDGQYEEEKESFKSSENIKKIILPGKSLKLHMRYLIPLEKKYNELNFDVLINSSSGESIKRNYKLHRVDHSGILTDTLDL